ncbi:hypothetical protein [Pseudostreptobacillus hongkongensis]|uniref:type II secretion system protein GspD n=1 Tax=Pseudostreptobacillus hongkongensis TaxID=1162717 RepID=UPI0028D315A1|nr:hypothetical protein [Pseudostreptobacillus hongkongensis]
MKKLIILLLVISMVFPKNKYIKDEDMKKAKSISIEKVEKHVNKSKPKDNKIISEYRLQNLNAKDTIKNLNGLFDLELRELDNSIIMVGNKENILKLKEILHKIDRKKRQVLIKLNIIDTSYNLFDRLGFNWKLGSTKGENGYIAEFLENKLSLGSLLNIGGNILDIDIDALKEKGELSVKSTPSILVVEGSSGELKITDEMIINFGNKENKGIKSYEAGIIIKVKPKIVYKSYNEYIQMEIYTEISNFKLGTKSSNGKSQNILETEMIVKNNESIFIGGIESQGYKIHQNGVTGLSEIPIFGTFFKKRNNSKEKRSLYIEIESRIIE